jgi:hypothetical protein
MPLAIPMNSQPERSSQFREGKDLLDLITSVDPAVRNRPLSAVCEHRSADWLLEQVAALDDFRRRSENLYEQVRAIFFLSAIERYHLPARISPQQTGSIPFEGYQHLLQRRFSEAIDRFLCVQRDLGPSDGICSALAQAYRGLGFQILANQVRRSVRAVPGNQWMFRLGHPADQPLRIRPELLRRSELDGCYPVLCERTAVRMDFTHSAWSDIFFLGMDYPEGAQVLNVSINLEVYGRDREPSPPIETYLRVIDEPVLRLVSLDLNAQTEIFQIDETFDFARDYLGLLKAAVIAAGLVPPGIEGTELPIRELLDRLVGPGLGLEIVTSVNDIPKGSRLAVSTNLLGSLISLCMRATGQVSALVGPLAECDRRLVAARAILGEWLGGSGGGWQDSGGLWPGIKRISGTAARENDPEFGISRGRLLPEHVILDSDLVSSATREKLERSLVLVHGGMAQNVGPVLEMVTDKYLLRGEAEWQARQQTFGILQEIVAALQAGDIRALGAATTRNFFGPLQTIIPWCSNLYTESLIAQARAHYGERFWGFWMLGGMAGGGMGFIFDPEVKPLAQDWLRGAMTATKQRLQHSLPFAMEPVVYDFSINDRGTWAELLSDNSPALPSRYYALCVPAWLKTDVRLLSPLTRRELERFSAACRNNSPTASANMRQLLDRMLPQSGPEAVSERSLTELLEQNGFDVQQHEQIRAAMKHGRIGLAQNRLPANILIEDVHSNDVIDTRPGLEERYRDLGREAISEGSVAVITLAAGVGSRWTQGAGVVKALHPFCKFQGRHRTFLEVHLAKSQKACQDSRVSLPHVVTTSYSTHQPLHRALAEYRAYDSIHPLVLSPGRAVGLRLIPMVRDLRFAWEEMPQQLLDEQQQKVRNSLRSALIEWTQGMGEGNNYVDNIPQQCLHPVGHWQEVPNLLRNGTLAQLLAERPQLKYLLLHNIDTLGADVDPGLLGLHIAEGNCLSFEVIGRRLEDRGGGLARVNGQLRLVEGLAMPREQDEFALSYYNSMTTWIDIEQFLKVLGLTASDLTNQSVIEDAVRNLSRRIPIYSTLKDVKKRWGHGQEDIYPVAQFEQLWGDVSALPEVQCGFFVVPLFRGQQLKDPAQLDGWFQDGSANYVDSRCSWK